MRQPYKEDHYTEQETIARAEAALKRMLATPHKTHAEMQLGRSKQVAESKNMDSTVIKKKSGRRPSSKCG